MKKLLFAIITCLATSGLMAAEGITFGVIGLKPDREIQDYATMVSYLEKKLSVKVNVVVVPTIEKMVEKVAANEVNVLVHSPFIAAQVAEKTGTKMVLRQWKKGISEYSSSIFVKKGSPIQGLNDLKGKMIALEDRESASGCYLPKYILRKAGLKVVEKKNITDAVGKDEVGFVFSDEIDNSILWVKKDRVAGAGAQTSIIVKDSELHELAKSPMIPRAIVSFSAQLDSALATKLESTLLKMAGDPEAEKVLATFNKTTKFDKFPKSSNDIKKSILDLLKVIES